MTRSVHISFWIAILSSFMLWSCHRDDICSPEGQSPDASVFLSLSVPVVDYDVKSVSSSPSDPQDWTQWERVVDGRYLYRVTAFLLQGNRLVAYKDLDLSGMDEPSEAELSFDGNFVHGTYKLMVVANYSAHTADAGENSTRTYDGLSGFSDTVRDILNTSGVIEHFTTGYADSFMNFMIASDEGVCPQVPQPLTLVKDIELHPGLNLIEGELLRTYSRVRIVVENQSDEPLKLNSLAFDDLFTQSESYLFPGVGYSSERTALNIKHADALTPFNATDDSPMVIDAQSSAVIFDAYVLESQRGVGEPGYTYSLGLGYGGSENYRLKSTTAITSTSGISKGYYMIYSARRSRYLKAGNTKVESASLGSLQTGATISKEYVWALDNTGLSANRYYIGTPEILQSGDQTSYYMAQTSNSSVTLNSKFSSNYYFTFATYTYSRNDYLSIRASSSSSNRYLQVTSNGNVTGTTSSPGNDTRFYLYPVEYSGSSVHEIPLRTIDNKTGQVADVSEVKRNDFINVLVAVSYNKNTGHFMFEVKNWESAGGDISFN